MDSRQISTIATVFLIWVSPCSAQLFLGENVVVITAESGGEISGQVCNYSKNWCVEVSEDSGTARVEVELDYGELAGFSGQLDNAVVNLVEQHAIRNNYDWLERIVLVLAGAVAGLVGNVFMALYSDGRKDHVEQRAKFRTWRDKVLQRIKDRQTDDEVKFSVEIPDGLSKKTSAKIVGIEAKLSIIENKLHAQPDQKNALLKDAQELVLGTST
jgi:hypothetical protein